MQLDVLESVRESYVEYVLDTYGFRDKEFQSAFRELIENRGLSKGPFLEVVPSYEQAGETADVFRDALGTPMDEDTLEALGVHPKLYWHQQESINRVADDRNVLVASGTGSGKTEAFLYPILLHLYKEQLEGTLDEPGVRALILYPMNALSNDQLDRLGELAERLDDSGSSFQFTYGQYTGETPENIEDEHRDGEAKARDRRPGELVFREEIRDSPPDILLTNYSMLEYLLLRPEDSPLFDNGAAEHWKFLVVDEAHQYNGTKGAEVGLLLRRLKQRLREGGRRDGFTAIATSATIAEGPRDAERVADFASDLFGEPFDQEDILLGRTVDVPEPENLPGFDPDSRSAETSRDLLSRPRFREFLDEAMGEPQTVRELSEKLSESEMMIEEWANQVTELVHPETGYPLFSARFHLLVRTIPGLYVRFHPGKRIALNPEGEEGSAWFSAALCTRCGQHYLQGTLEDGHLREPYDKPTSREEQTRVFLPVDEEGPDAWELDVQTGRILDPQARKHASLDGESILLEWVRPGGSSKSGTVTKCPVCGFSAREPIRSPRVAVNESQSLMALSIHKALPEGRKRLLAFADGRQDAARFAYSTQDFADSVRLRSHAVDLLSDVGDQVVGFEDLATDLAGRIGGSRRRRDRVAYKDAYKFLLKEVLDPSDASNLADLGYLGSMVDLDPSTPIPDELLELTGLTEDETRHFLQILAWTLLKDQAVELGNLDVLVPWSDLELPGQPTAVGIGDVSGRNNWKSWDTPRGRRGNYTRRLLERRGQPFDSDKVEKILQLAWGVLEDAEDEVGTKILVPGPDGFALDVRTLIFERLDMGRLECDLCGLNIPEGPLSVCPRHRCQGELQSRSDETAKRNPFRELYDDPIQDEYSIEEHTAQLSKNDARDFQAEFKRGEIDALSSSTTFELGVDLGALDAIFLRNIPPEPFNYTQRVGRTGRRKGRPGMVLAFARQRSHDFYHYAQPDMMLGGKVRPPAISLSNEKILARHVNAVVLGDFFEQNPDRIKELSKFVASDEDPKVLEDIKNHIQRRIKVLEDRLHGAFGEIEVAGRILETGRWKDWVTQPADRLGEAALEYLDDLQHLRELKESAAEAEDYNTADWARQRARTLQSDRVIGFLSRKAVIPKYGFPVDVVSLDTQPRNRVERRNSVRLQRDLTIALREYAPGQEVVANKQAWRSVAVKTVRHKELAQRKFYACPVHGFFKEFRPGEEERVDHNCEHMTWGTYLVPSFGFLTYPGESKEPTGQRPGVNTTRPFFAGLVDEDDDDGEWEDPGLHALSVSTASPGDMVILGSTGKGQPYHLCTECGLQVGRNNRGDAHTPPNIRKRARNDDDLQCHGNVRQFHLAHKFTTTVLRLAFHTVEPPPDSRRRAGFFAGLGTAISEAAAEVLQVPSSEIGYTLSGGTGEDNPMRLVLYDTAPGGAGLVERLEDTDLLEEVLATAADRTSGSCGCADDASCYSCLRTYENQWVHPRLERGPVYEAVAGVLQNGAPKGL